MIVASDQGTIITRNARTSDPREVTWSSWLNQPTAQMYHVSVDHRFPYWVTGAQQDSGAVAVCVRGKFGEISTRDWEPIGAGGESGYTAGDPLHPGIIYGGTGNRFDLALNRNVPGTTAPEVPDGVKARTDWTQPLVLSRSRSARAVLRKPVSLQVHRLGADVDAHQRRPHAADPERAAHTRRGRRGRRRSHARQRRRDLHRRALAAARADDLDRHRRRADQGHDRRRQGAGGTSRRRRSPRGAA